MTASFSAPLKNKQKEAAFVLWLIIAVVFFWNLSLGPGDIRVRDVFDFLYGYIFGTAEAEGTLYLLIWQVRLPRSLLALLIGSALGASGAVTQGLFRNPLASPNILGLSSGAAVMTLAGISLGIDERALWATPMTAALGVLLSLFLLYWITKRWEGGTSLLLCGVALGALFSAGITFLLSINIKNYEISLKMSQWLLGSFDARSWPHLRWSLGPIGIGLLFSLYLRKNLNILHLGPDTASSLGVHLRMTYLGSVLCVGLLVGTATALVGIIAFMGLVVPHLARLLVGASHSRILPFSISLGAALMLFVDILSRTITSVYLAPGAVTSLAGAPLFLHLLRRYYKR